jgi:hypothetical protein
VTITGNEFSGATAVKFGSTNAASFTVNPEGTSITAVSPPGTGVVDVTVTTPAGTSATSSADQFSYGALSLPTVTAVNPKEGPSSVHTTVTITGSHFVGPTAVNFGSKPANFRVVSESTISAETPSQNNQTSFFEWVPLSVDVTVTTPAGTSATSPADVYTYTAK